MKIPVYFYEYRNAFEQCHNCKNKKHFLFGRVFCKSEGVLKIKELKKNSHCAAQDEITKMT